MKGIVVRQPWATLIALGVKSIETRPSPPNGPMRPEGVRGLPGCTLERGERIAIVAGAGRPPDYEDAPGAWDALAECFQITTVEGLAVAGPGIANVVRARLLTYDVPLGAVVCTVTVDDVAMVDDSGILAAATWPVISRPEIEPDRWVFWGSLGRASDITDQVALGWFDDGRWGWLLGGVKPTLPVPCKGRQGVFVLPDDVAGFAGAPS